MNISEIKKLAEIMKNYELTTLEVDGENIKMKREVSVFTQAVATKPVVAPVVIETKSVEEKPVESGKIFTSPTVGVFYASPSPDKDAFINMGSTVKSGDVVCIIEAMKLMNEIQADFEGEITQIFVKNGDVVEYGQNLFSYK